MFALSKSWLVAHIRHGDIFTSFPCLNTRARALTIHYSSFIIHHLSFIIYHLLLIIRFMTTVIQTTIIQHMILDLRHFHILHVACCMIFLESIIFVFSKSCRLRLKRNLGKDLKCWKSQKTHHLMSSKVKYLIFCF